MKRWLNLWVATAIIGVFLPPFLSGSNHKCPVLREKDLANGSSAEAIPAFARKYNVDCTYCHTAWPQLNRTGYMFRRRGYRMPWEVPTLSNAPSAPTAPQPQSSASKTGLPPAVTSGLTNAVKAAKKEPASPEKIAEGQKVFEQMQCATCHVNGGNVINPSKPIKGADFLKKYPDDAQIAQVIRHGVPGTAMPAFGQDRLSDSQLELLTAYIRSLTPSP